MRLPFDRGRQKGSRKGQAPSASFLFALRKVRAGVSLLFPRGRFPAARCELYRKHALPLSLFRNGNVSPKISKHRPLHFLFALLRSPCGRVPAVPPWTFPRCAARVVSQACVAAKSFRKRQSVPQNDKLRPLHFPSPRGKTRAGVFPAVPAWAFSLLFPRGCFPAAQRGNAPSVYGAALRPSVFAPRCKFVKSFLLH